MRRAARLSLPLDPVTAFEALCALESRDNLSEHELMLVAALRVALRPGVRVALRSLVRAEAP